LDENGYLLIKNLIDKEICDKMVEELLERAKILKGVDRNDYHTWKNISPLGFFDIWHAPTYYTLREHPLLYSIFAQLLHEPELTVSLDRVCLGAPSIVRDPQTGDVIAELPERKNAVFNVHTDMNLWYLKENKYQGGLALVDCPTGGFQCVPGFHKLAEIRRYRERYQAGEFGERPVPGPDDHFVYFQDRELANARLKQIPMEKGDFIIWSNRLPHTAMANQTDQWRIHCYIRYLPAALHPVYRDEVAQAVCSGRKPLLFSTGNATDRNNMDIEVGIHKMPKLSELGQRLLGLAPWPSEVEPQSSAQ
jgi:hypothetical protein